MRNSKNVPGITNHIAFEVKRKSIPSSSQFRPHDFRLRKVVLFAAVLIRSLIMHTTLYWVIIYESANFVPYDIDVQAITKILLVNVPFVNDLIFLVTTLYSL